MPKFGLIHYNYASKSLDDFLKFTSETGFGLKMQEFLKAS